MQMRAIVLAAAIVAGGNASLSRGVHAQSNGEGPAMRVRYIVNDLGPAIDFYTHRLAFHLLSQAGRNFAILSRGNLQLILSPPTGPGGASQAMPDGRRPEAGGWNRIVLDTHDLVKEVDVLRKAGVHFRNDVTSGPGGKQILLEDPSHNPIELFQSGY